MRKSLKRWLIPMSAAMIALLSAGTVLAADTVNVKVENTRGGYLNARYWDEDENIIYLPIGEVSQVPKGTDIQFDTMALDYHLKNGKYYHSLATDVQVTDKNNITKSVVGVKESDDSLIGMFSADSDMTLRGIFKASLEEENDNENYAPELGFNLDDSFSTEIGMANAGNFSEQLYIYNYQDDKFYVARADNNVKIIMVSYYDTNNQYHSEYSDESFNVDKNGKIVSTKTLKKGEYYVNGVYTYQGKSNLFDINIVVGSRIETRVPLCKYKNNESSNDYIVRSESLETTYVDNPNQTTFNSVVPLINGKLAGHKLTGLSEKRKSEFNNIGTKKVDSKLSEKDRTAYVVGIFENYEIPVVEHFTEEDITPEKVTVGWNKIKDEWYYYVTTDPSSLAKKQWVPCRENDGENVWVGADGKVVTDAVVTDGTDKYLVDAKGHKMRNKTGYTLGNVDYTTDENGKITGSKLHLATPSDAAKADQFVKDVMDNMDSLSQVDREKAADMTTEALQKKVDTSKLTKEEMKQYADLYRAVYGEGSIEIGGSDDNDAMIVAAGLTSKDFEDDGSVTIELKSNWLATSSNAVKVELALYVNGKARALTAPVKVEVELPEAFVASYSNASYNFSVSPKPVSYEIKDGKMIITISKADVYKVQATKKSSGSSGSHSSSSGGSGRATVKAEYKASDGKTGNWVLDNKGWWFKYQDGTWPKSQWLELEWNNVKSWYYFGADGYMVTGWYQDGGKWYYLHPKTDGTRGYMYTGWHQIGNNWYYFRVTVGGPKGSLVVNDTTPDGYKVNGNGEWVK